MSPQDPVHAGAVENANNTLTSLLGTEFSVRVQLPLSAPNEPELRSLRERKPLRSSRYKEYWIINLEDYVLEVLTEPGVASDNPFGYAYGRKKSITPGEQYRFMDKNIPVSMLFDGLLDH